MKHWRYIFLTSLVSAWTNVHAKEADNKVVEIRGAHSKSPFHYLFEPVPRGSLGEAYSEFRPADFSFDPSWQLKPLNPLELRVVKVVSDRGFENGATSTFYFVQTEHKLTLERLSDEPHDEAKKFLPTASLMLSMLKHWRQSIDPNASIASFRGKAEGMIAHYKLSQSTPETYLFGEARTLRGDPRAFQIQHLYPFSAAEFFIHLLPWSLIREVEIRSIDMTYIPNGMKIYSDLVSFLRQTHGTEPVSYDPKSQRGDFVALSSEITPEKLISRFPAETIVRMHRPISNFSYSDTLETRDRGPSLWKKCCDGLRSLFKKLK